MNAVGREDYRVRSRATSTRKLWMTTRGTRCLPLWLHPTSSRAWSRKHGAVLRPLLSRCSRTGCSLKPCIGGALVHALANWSAPTLLQTFSLLGWHTSSATCFAKYSTYLSPSTCNSLFCSLTSLPLSHSRQISIPRCQLHPRALLRVSMYQHQNLCHL